MTGEADVPPPPPGAGGPPPIPMKSGHGPLFWILVSLGGLFVLCCAGGLIVFVVAREKFKEFAAMPEDERKAAILEAVAGEESHAASEFIKAIDEERDEDAWAMTAPTFRVLTPRDKFAEMTELVGQVLGRCQSKHLTNANVKTQVGSGSTASLDYAAKFERGDGTIHLDLVKIDGTWKVASWRTDSPLFLDAMKRGSGK